MTEKILKFLFSIPVILVVLYFLPFLGVCLLIAKFFLQKGYRRLDSYSKSMMWIIATGLILFVPIMIDFVTKQLKINDIPLLKNVLDSDIYKGLIPYGKRLITVGIILIIVGYIVRRLFEKVTSKIESIKRDAKETITTHLENEEQRVQENDMRLKEQQIKAENFRVVKCPNCGAINQLTEKTGKCKSCRNVIE